ncbi:hypothetical protein BCR33DRAFT_742900 [Rhizoclosmatium globosum]|uniref:Uncharacterized protein n=1 Tax=Rhizoclosmatium globosum TaxID=329046 RepID=A0A1Y2BNF4_9FUNG|nr:hypothetical protein BCR33DRAFT_742900 [Rhizoclosmatium globosum]|eukprot:ORY36107.1 hypothetical protein BCR33DRAFT_742900 [Rhizoclosmatium globosum]
MKDGMVKNAILFAKEHTKNLNGLEDWKNVTKEFIKTQGAEMLEEKMPGLAHNLEKTLETGELVAIDPNQNNLDAKEAEVQQVEQPKKEVKTEVDQHDIDLR